jgi:regulator of sirC expression with transglutaminase-like and TPR domain
VNASCYSPHVPELFSDKQKQSLFRLLANEEGQTLTLLKQQLLDKGEGAVPEFEGWLKEVNGSPAETHIFDVVKQLKYGSCHKEFLDFCSQASISEDFDLEDGAFLLAMTEFPATRMDKYRSVIDDLVAEIRIQMAREGNPSAIRAVSHVLHEKFGFRGNREHYFDSDNTYINRLLDRKLGVPITLSLLYLILGKRLDVPIFGVALPGHFIVGWQGKYFDPFNRGRPLKEEDCAKLVESHNQDFHQQYLMPATPHQVMGRMLRNLIRVYEKEEDHTRVARVTKYLNALEGEV